jgi:geranylgeranyl diphosphate synthase type II
VRYYTSTLTELLVPVREGIEVALLRLCDEYADDASLEVVEPLIRYTLLGGGKRFRGILLCAAYAAARKHDTPALPRYVHDLGAAVEVVHAYSLVHDDLPCMDDDDIRRGRQSVHRRFDVSRATAAGVIMVPLAARAAARAAAALGLSETGIAEVVRSLMHAAGATGMIAGQMLDLEGEGKTLLVGDLERIHRAKTGALIAAAASIGGMAARGTEAAVAALSEYGQLLGLAFQITDDLLDVTASTAILGKTAGRDRELGKSTYPVLLGLAGAEQRARECAFEAGNVLRRAGLLSPILDALPAYVIGRQS